MLLHIGLCNFTYMCILRINHGSLVCKDFQHKSLNALISNLWIYRYCTLYRVTNFLWKPVGRNHFKLVPQLRKWKINWCHHSTHRKSIDWAWKKWRGNPIKFHTEIIQPQLLKKQLAAKLLKHPICQKIAYTALDQKQNSYAAEKPQFVSWLKVVG